jgi:hypothetical protein
VRCHNDFTILWMNGHFVDRNGWQALIELSPILAAIDRHPKAKLSAQI